MKKQTFETLEKYFENESPVEREQVIAQLEIEMGLSKKKAKEYIDTLKTASRIGENGDGLLTYEGGGFDE